MRTSILSVSLLMLGSTAGAFAQASKVGIINIQAAIANTKDGQKASNELSTKFAPTKARLEKKQADIEADKTRLNTGSNAMSEDQKAKLRMDIEQKTKALNRDAEDAQAEVDQETGKIMQTLGERIMVVVKKYAQDKGYTLILDVSNQQTSPVLYASDGIEITGDVIKLYDENSPAPASAPAASAPAATPKPPVASPAKKAPPK